MAWRPARRRQGYAGDVATWGKIDVLFSNAGNDGPIIPTVGYPEDLFDRIIATHVRGCFLACKYTLPQTNDGGSIVITSSITGVKGVPGNCSYVAAKHVLVGLMRCIAKEVVPRRIRVNTANPGPIDNTFVRTAEKSMSQMIGRDRRRNVRRDHPRGTSRTASRGRRCGAIPRIRQEQLYERLDLMFDGAMCA